MVKKAKKIYVGGSVKNGKDGAPGSTLVDRNPRISDHSNRSNEDWFSLAVYDLAVYDAVLSHEQDPPVVGLSAKTVKTRTGEAGAREGSVFTPSSEDIIAELIEQGLLEPLGDQKRGVKRVKKPTASAGLLPGGDRLVSVIQPAEREKHPLCMRESAPAGPVACGTGAAKGAEIRVASLTVTGPLK